jgi:uncharacterized protein YqgC (DUF456 family)
MYFRGKDFMFTTILIVLGFVLLLAGIIGCFLPVVPGPPLCFLALLIQQIADPPMFTLRFIMLWGVVALVVSVLDYIIPVYGTRRVGGTKYGIWGCTIGLLVGIWFGPAGIIVGPFLGALIGELLAGRDAGNAMRSAFGSFFGFLVGTLLKLIVCLVMGWHLVSETYRVAVG